MNYVVKIAHKGNYSNCDYLWKGRSKLEMSVLWTISF